MMNIYIAKDEQKQGPYTLPEVHARILSGQFNENDLGWYDGLADWLPLSKMLNRPPPHPGGMPPIPKTSKLAVASFMIGLIGIPVWFALIIAAAAGVNTGCKETSKLMVAIGLSIFAFMGVNLAGCILGIFACKKPFSNQWMVFSGIIANAVELLGIFLLMMIGLMKK